MRLQHPLLKNKIFALQLKSIKSGMFSSLKKMLSLDMRCMFGNVVVGSDSFKAENHTVHERSTTNKKS